jgi:hypothetical protein
MARAWRWWVAVLDRREPPTALALVRIGLATVLLVDYLDVWRAGLVGPLWSRPPDGFAIGDALLGAHALWLIATLALVLIAVGAATRVACIAFVLASAQLAALTPDGESALDMLARVVFVILALSGCNARWSIDALVFRRPAGAIPAWPRYLLLLQLVWVYFSGGIDKSIAAWGPTGGFTALANALQDPHAARFGPAWVGAVYPLTRVATALTMAFELAAPLFVVAYFRRWRVRWVWIGLGVAFELGIAIGLRLGSFPYGMLALYPVLLQPEELQRLNAPVPAKRASSPS